MNINKLAELAMLSIEDGNLKGLESLEAELQTIIERVKLPQDLTFDLQLSAENAMELRDDEIVQSLSREDVLLNAPQKQAGCFVVPKIVGEE